MCVCVCIIKTNTFPPAGVPAMPRESPKSRTVDEFFASMYMSAAETLPLGQIQGRPETTIMNEETDATLTSLVAGQETGVEAITALSRHVGRGENMVVKYLPPGRLKDLYWVYLSSMSCLTGETEAASATTFWRRWHEYWHALLRFRKRTTHSMCNTCFRLQQELRYSKGLEMRVAIATRLRDHLAGQFADRHIYWSVRHASRMRQDILCIIVDSMDKSKFALPRWPYAATPKDVENIPRPTITLTAAWVHGHALCLFMSDETIAMGADGYIEVLLRSIDKSIKQLSSLQMDLPGHLYIQAGRRVFVMT